jgi:hypothetical protein
MSEFAMEHSGETRSKCPSSTWTFKDLEWLVFQESQGPSVLLYHGHSKFEDLNVRIR